MTEEVKRIAINQNNSCFAVYTNTEIKIYDTDSAKVRNNRYLMYLFSYYAQLSLKVVKRLQLLNFVMKQI